MVKIVEKLTSFQTGFTKGRRTLGNIFVTRTFVDKYLRAERDRLYWCFVDFEKAFYSSNRVALRFKMRKMAVSESIGNCIKIIYQDIKFCVKCGENLISIVQLKQKGSVKFEF